MSITIIGVIILLGLLLVVTEIFLTPGTTFVGIAGLIVLGIGIYYSFAEYGLTIGASVLLGSALLIGLLTYKGIQRMENSQFSVKATIDSKVNEFDYSNIDVGDEGTTITALRPEGKAYINDDRVTVFSNGEYIDPDSTIVVIKIVDNKIFVQTKT